MARNNYPGAYFVFNRKVMLTSSASKVYSKSFNDFESINSKNLAEVNKYGIEIDENMVPKVDKNLQVKSNFPEKVFLLKLITGLNHDIIMFFFEQDYIRIDL